MFLFFGFRQGRVHLYSIPHFAAPHKRAARLLRALPPDFM